MINKKHCLKKENLYCHRCGHELGLLDEEVINEDGRGSYYRFICPHCGAIYEIDEPDEEEKKEYEFWKDEDISERVGNEGDHIMNDICLNCGHKVYVSNNFMLSDCGGTDLSKDDDKMNYCLSPCSHCGCTEVRWDNSENEKKDFPYWEQDTKLHELLKDYYFNYTIHIWQEVNNKSDEEILLYLKDVMKLYSNH